MRYYLRARASAACGLAYHLKTVKRRKMHACAACKRLWCINLWRYWTMAYMSSVRVKDIEKIGNLATLQGSCEFQIVLLKTCNM